MAFSKYFNQHPDIFILEDDVESILLPNAERRSSLIRVRYQVGCQIVDRECL